MGKKGSIHTEYILGVNEALEIAKGLGTLFDEPFGDPSGIPTLLVSRLAGQEVKVVLSADGGYQVYTSVLERMKMLDRVPRWLGHTLSAGKSQLPHRLSGAAQMRIAVPRIVRGDLLRRIHRLGSMLKDPTARRLMDLYSSYWEPERDRPTDRRLRLSATKREFLRRSVGLAVKFVALSALSSRGHSD